MEVRMVTSREIVEAPLKLLGSSESFRGSPNTSK